MKVFFRVKNLVGSETQIPYNYNIYNALDGAFLLLVAMAYSVFTI